MEWVVGKKSCSRRSRAHPDAKEREIAERDRGSEGEKLVLFAFAFVPLCKGAPVARDGEVDRTSKRDEIDGGAKLGRLAQIEVVTRELGVFGAEREDRDVRRGLEDGEGGELALGGDVLDAR
jgi:hypothetical protein